MAFGKATTNLMTVADTVASAPIGASFYVDGQRVDREMAGRCAVHGMAVRIEEPREIWHYDCDWVSI